MTTNAQHKAVSNYRQRLRDRGMSRLEIVGRREDRDLLREVARLLAEDGPKADHLRTVLNDTVAPVDDRGAIYTALRRSPLVGETLATHRPRTAGRKVSL